MPAGNKALISRNGQLLSSAYLVLILSTFFFGFILQHPSGNPCKCLSASEESHTNADKDITFSCQLQKFALKTVQNIMEIFQELIQLILNAIYQTKIETYKLLAEWNGKKVCSCRFVCGNGPLPEAKELTKDEMDKVIEDDLTQKLSEDLMQSIERKFQVDLERSVDMVLGKIKLLLQNGTTHIQESLEELQNILDMMRQHTGGQVDACLKSKHNETSTLAEKALHQMVVCGYALIGQDPSKAVGRVVDLKNMIRQGVKPIHAKKAEIDRLLKACGHEHDTLKNVIKCVISKSPIIKVSMMEITGKLIEGVVDLTKLMAHGAMHEACLIEVVRTLEQEAFDIISTVKDCVYGNYSYFDDVSNYLVENNATVLDIEKRKGTDDLIENKKKEFDEKLIEKMQKLQNKLDDAKDIKALV